MLTSFPRLMILSRDNPRSSSFSYSSFFLSSWTCSNLRLGSEIHGSIRGDVVSLARLLNGNESDVLDLNPILEDSLDGICLAVSSFLESFAGSRSYLSHRIWSFLISLVAMGSRFVSRWRKSCGQVFGRPEIARIASFCRLCRLRMCVLQIQPCQLLEAYSMTLRMYWMYRRRCVSGEQPQLFVARHLRILIRFLHLETTALMCLVNRRLLLIVTPRNL